MRPPGRHRGPGTARARSTVMLLVTVLFAVVACSGSGEGRAGGIPGADVRRETLCSLVQRLGNVGASLSGTDVADPAAFEVALDAAVSEYLTVLDGIEEAAPEALAVELGEPRGLVEQHRFTDAVVARAPLDEHVARTCPAVDRADGPDDGGRGEATEDAEADPR